MTRRGRRNGSGNQRSQPQRPTAALQPDGAASTVLLGLLIVEATLRCEAERRHVDEQLRIRVNTAKRDYEDYDMWLDRQRLWRPAACEVEFLPTSLGALTAAPVVTLVARRDATDRSEGRERFVRFSLCSRGLVRIEKKEWPEDAPQVSLPKVPTSIADAQDWAKRVVDRALPTLFDFVDPLKPA